MNVLGGIMDVKMIEKLSHAIGEDWKPLAQCLNMRQVRIQAILRNNIDTGHWQATQEMLLSWVSKLPRAANKVVEFIVNFNLKLGYILVRNIKITVRKFDSCYMPMRELQRRRLRLVEEKAITVRLKIHLVIFRIFSLALIWSNLNYYYRLSWCPIIKLNIFFLFNIQNQIAFNISVIL